MFSRIESWIYRICRYIHLRLQKAFIRNHIMCVTPPHILGKIYLNAKNVKVGKNVTFYPGVYLWGNDIEIGDNVDIGVGTIIYSKNGIKIGDNTIIAGQCYIIDSNHGMKAGQLIREQDDSAAEGGIVIGSDVWIAAQCSILKGARIHNHAVIGAQSLVNSEIPKKAIALGTPAKVIKYRY